MSGGRFATFIRVVKTGWVDLFFMILLFTLLTKIILLVRTSPRNLTDWLLVYLTAVYALLTLYMALVSVKSALAAERSAKAMEDSLQEARMTRWAQFAATVNLPDGEFYYVGDDGSVALRLSNVFGQPMADLNVAMWQTETNASDEREVRYSSMMRSATRSVMATEQSFIVELRPANALESECRGLGELALMRFKQVYNRMPIHTLCMIWYYHRADLNNPMQLVYDLRPYGTQETPLAKKG